MCIAILKTKKGVVTDEELRESFRSNSDGAGIAYTKDNKLYIVKGIFDENTFVNTVREVEKICDNNMLIHCRIGTSGKKDKTNTHPFFVNSNVALIHNGVLSVDVPLNSEKNDTQIFIEKYLKDISTKNLMYSKSLHNLISNAIGKNNKFVLMDNTGRYKIINEKQGHWKDNVWFSNSSYKSYTRSYGYYGRDYDDWDEYDKFVTRWNNCQTYGKQGKLPLTVDNVVEDEDKKDNLSVNDYFYIEEQISHLTFEQFAALDLYPVLDLKTNKLMTYEQASAMLDRSEYEFLEDVSPDLFDYYMDCFNSAEEFMYEDMNEVA